MFASLPNCIHSLVVVPDVAFVQFNHNIERPFAGVFIRVLQQREDKVLKFFVDGMILAVFV